MFSRVGFVWWVRSDSFTRLAFLHVQLQFLILLDWVKTLKLAVSFLTCTIMVSLSA
jgi:hypothetical protein